MCDGVDGYSRLFGAQNKSVEELNFRGSFDCGETMKGLRLQVESREVKRVAAELMVNGSSPGTRRIGHDGFKMAEVIFVKVEFVRICAKYVYE